eukprot:scpid47659/ scgid1927/ 
MEQRHRIALQRNHVTLKTSLHPQGHVLDSLYADRIIQRYDKQHVLVDKSGTERDSPSQAEELLKYLPTLGSNAFEAFLKALRDSELDVHLQLVKKLEASVADVETEEESLAKEKANENVGKRRIHSDVTAAYSSGTHITAQQERHTGHYSDVHFSGGKKQQGHLPVGHAVAMFQPLRIQAQPLLSGVTLEEQVMPSNGGVPMVHPQYGYTAETPRPTSSTLSSVSNASISSHDSSLHSSGLLAGNHDPSSAVMMESGVGAAPQYQEQGSNSSRYSSDGVEEYQGTAAQPSITDMIVTSDGCSVSGPLGAGSDLGALNDIIPVREEGNWPLQAAVHHADHVPQLTPSVVGNQGQREEFSPQQATQEHHVIAQQSGQQPTGELLQPLYAANTMAPPQQSPSSLYPVAQNVPVEHNIVPALQPSQPPKATQYLQHDPQHQVTQQFPAQAGPSQLGHANTYQIPVPSQQVVLPSQGQLHPSSNIPVRHSQPHQLQNPVNPAAPEKGAAGASQPYAYTKSFVHHRFEAQGFQASAHSPSQKRALSEQHHHTPASHHHHTPVSQQHHHTVPVSQQSYPSQSVQAQIVPSHEQPLQLSPARQQGLEYPQQHAHNQYTVDSQLQHNHSTSPFIEPQQQSQYQQQQNQIQPHLQHQVQHQQQMQQHQEHQLQQHQQHQSQQHQQQQM